MKYFAAYLKKIKVIKRHYERNNSFILSRKPILHNACMSLIDSNCHVSASSTVYRIHRVSTRIVTCHICWQSANIMSHAEWSSATCYSSARPSRASVGTYHGGNYGRFSIYRVSQSTVTYLLSTQNLWSIWNQCPW